MKTFECKDIREVWDFRLSRGNPILYDNGPTWRVVVYDNHAPDGDRIVLAEHTTDVPTNGDPRDPDGVRACFEWLYSVRDQFSRDHIELRKPVVAMINAANRIANAINTEALLADRMGEMGLANEKRGELAEHLKSANAEIKDATQAMNVEIAGGAQ